MPGPPSKEAREAARAALKRGESQNAVSKATGIDRKTLRSMIQRENIIPQAIPHIGEAEAQAVRAETRSNVVSIATRQAVEQLAASGLIDQQADDIAVSLQTHGKISRMMLEYAERMMQDAIDGKVWAGEKQSQADVFNSIVTGVAKAVAASRDIAGLKTGQTSFDTGAKIDPNITLTIKRLPKTREEYENGKVA